MREEHLSYDSYGSVLQSVYYAYDNVLNSHAGQQLLSDGTTGNDLRYLFTSQEYNVGTGMYYYNRRDYDPRVAKFLQEDPIVWVGGLWSLGVYVGNNPINYTDPTGMVAGHMTNVITNQKIEEALHRAQMRLNHLQNTVLDNAAHEDKINAYRAYLDALKHAQQLIAYRHKSSDIILNVDCYIKQLNQLPTTVDGLGETPGADEEFLRVAEQLTSVGITILKLFQRREGQADFAEGFVWGAGIALVTLATGGYALGAIAAYAGTTAAATVGTTALTTFIFIDAGERSRGGQESGALASSAFNALTLGIYEAVTDKDVTGRSLNSTPYERGARVGGATATVATLGGALAKGVSRFFKGGGQKCPQSGTNVIETSRGVDFTADLTKSSAKTRPGHRNAGNKQLHERMQADPEFRKQMEAKYGDDVFDRTSTSNGGRRNPRDAEWHHPDDPNSLELLKKSDHRSPSNQSTLHPDGRGGYSRNRSEKGWLE